MNTCSQILSPVYLTQTPGCITSVALLPENSSSSLPCPFSILFQNSLTLDLSNTFSHFPLGYFIQLEKNPQFLLFGLNWVWHSNPLMWTWSPLSLCCSRGFYFISFSFNLLNHHSLFLFRADILTYQFSSVAQSCLVLCNPMGQASLSITNSQSLPKLMTVKSVMHLTISSSVGPFSSFFQSFA